MSPRLAALLPLVALAACATPPAPAASPAPLPPEPEPPPAPSASASAAPSSLATAPVVVAIVIDQLAAWVAHERLPLLPADGGFARLRREGTWLVEAHHPHAATDTAPGHAVLHTGAPPSVSGIYGNELPDDKGSRDSILRDKNTKLVSHEGPTALVGSSAALLRTDTLADRLRARFPQAFIASVSLKDRGAIFGCGRKPDVCLWFDTAIDGFVTSTAFAQALPAWARAEAEPEAFARARAAPWTPLDLPWLEANTTADDQRGEGDWHGLGVTFPHNASAARKPAAAFRATPAGDTRVLTMAALAARQEAAGKTPTLLSVSLSSNDYVGHVFGPESREAWDHLRRLDAALAAFFRGLDARFGPNRYAVVLSADHGVGPMPETHNTRGARPWCRGEADRWKRPCVAGGRLHSDALAKTLDAAAARALGKGSWVFGVADPFVYFTPQARALPPDRRAKLVDVVTKEALRDPCVDRLVDARKPPAACPPLTDESIDALLCRSIPPSIEGELYVLPKPGCFFDADYTPGFGSSHGTPYLYDRTVPILARAPGRIAENRVIDEPRSSLAYAATIAALLGVEAPETTQGVAPLTTR